MRQSKESSLINFLIINSIATTNCIPEKASWLRDGLAAVQSLESKDTYGEWIESLIPFIIPPKLTECILVRMVNDTYRELSTKNNTRNQRGEGHIKTAIEGLEQYMPAGMK